MEKMFRKPFHSRKDEDTIKTLPLGLIHSDVISSMQTQTMSSYRYIIMCTNDYSRYTDVYFMKAKSEAPTKIKEYVAKVEKQHPKKRVCRIRVDGGGEYGSRENFLEYLTEEGIVRDILLTTTEWPLGEMQLLSNGSSTINAQACGNAKQTLG